MKKLTRLKWVPMIVKAYIDARTQTLLERQQRADPIAPTAPQFVENIPTPIPSVAVPVTKAKTHMTKSKKKTNHISKKISLAPVTKRQRQSYDLLFKELLDAKRKIHRLESLHREIGQVQNDLDQRLLQIAGHLRKQDSKSRK